MRMVSIDMLRGLAVILVLFRHFGIVEVLGKIGWSGVDLFFVLSGFLVSGLLFKEYKQTAAIDATRFLVRRGLKIYPAFYVFITFTIAKVILVDLLNIEGNKNFSVHALFSEIFFVQNYFERLWAHTWSLAVEEHFYLGLILAVTFLVSKNRLGNQKLFNALFFLMAFLCLGLRATHYGKAPFTLDTHLYYTHLRIDALCFGAFLAHQYYFNAERLKRFVDVCKVHLMIVAGGCLSFMFFLELDSFVMYTAGLTLTYIGYGIIVLLCIYSEHVFISANAFVVKVTRALAYVGLHSYSIYLWHLAVLIYIAEPLFRDLNNYLAFFVYFFGSIGVGVAVSKLVERPILKLRDNKFPVSVRYNVN